MKARPRLLFVSPQFLFPMDAGGKIRSANILKHLKGGAFETHLIMPAADEAAAAWKAEIDSLADQVTMWRAPARNTAWKARRAAGFLSAIPISAFADADQRAKSAVRTALSAGPDLVVFDYAQSLAMAPARIDAPHLFFAHNVETEILERHGAAAKGLMKFIWRREAAKMRRFERDACARCAGVIAVSERDAETFRRDFGANAAFAIPTGVDSRYFAFSPPAADAPPVLVFTGSMDWKANQDGLFWFMEEVWPQIFEKRADASFIVVGKNPPRAMTDRGKGLNWRFTGFVDDIRDHAKGAAYVIPLRVGGGTRIKAYEAMAMGLPVVSTALGVEGLPVTHDSHLLVADEPEKFAQAVLRLFDDPTLRTRLAQAARALVENNFSHEAAARVFESYCLKMMTG